MQGLVVVVEAPKPFAVRIQRESALWADVLKRSAITAEYFFMLGRLTRLKLSEMAHRASNRRNMR